MSKGKRKQLEPPVKVAPLVRSTVDQREATSMAFVSDCFLIKVNGQWMTSFHPLTCSDDRSKAKKMDAVTADVFARHIEYRGKGKCEVVAS